MESKIKFLLAGACCLVACSGGTTGPNLCGNGVLDNGEVCDDGNNRDGDGCSVQCRVESGFKCRNNVALVPVSDCFNSSGEQQKETFGDNTDHSGTDSDGTDHDNTDHSGTDSDSTDHDNTDHSGTDSDSTDHDNTDVDAPDPSQYEDHTDMPTEEKEEEGVDTELEITDYEEEPPEGDGASCTVDYHFQYDVSLKDAFASIILPGWQWQQEREQNAAALPAVSDWISYPEEDPPSLYRLVIGGKNGKKAQKSLIMPSYSDTLPLFDRAADWVVGEERCYMTSPTESRNYNQDEAYDLYVDIAQKTVGVTLNQTVGRRNVVGIRGAHPGQFFFNGDLPNRFNDTIVLLWRDTDGKHVREFPVNTNTGVQSSSTQSSSLRANRHYRYTNGLHKQYNALHNSEVSYATRDDANNNAHIDNDRNGWLSPTATKDYDRTGSGHNIHYGKANTLETAAVGVWSAGCQVIPGMKNWTTFITNAWTASGDAVDYYLVDVRDIDKRVWSDCTPDGTHDCPYPITFTNGSFSASGTLAKNVNDSEFDVYNCGAQNESGPEDVYFFTWDGLGSAKKSLTIKVTSTNGDPDIHLLNSDDDKDCVVRNDKTITATIVPGRYFIIVDTFVKTDGTVRVGDYQLSVTLK